MKIEQMSEKDIYEYLNKIIEKINSEMDRLGNIKADVYELRRRLCPWETLPKQDRT